MKPQNGKYEKISFEFHSNLLDEWTIETLWGETIDKAKGLYKIDSIPFYASIASDDIIFAEYDGIEDRLVYKETIEPSGNSLVQIVILDRSIATNDIRDIFSELNCKSEKFDEGYFVMEILAGEDYKLIKAKLNELSASGVIDYAEPVLSNGHHLNLD